MPNPPTRPLSLDDALDDALDAYRTQAKSFQPSATAKGAAFTAAATAALALAPSADAAIAYTNPTDITRALSPTGADETTAFIDLDGFGEADFSFKIKRYFATFTESDITTLRYRDQSIRIAAIGNALGVVPAGPAPNPNVARLTNGVAVASFAKPNMLRFFTSETVNGGSSTGGLWFGNTMNLAAAGFVGVAINNAGSTNYGWIRIGISNDATGAPVAFTVYDWAYETEANTPITVGLIPEPSPAAGLALLAAGAAGIAAWRRRKQPTA